MLDGNDEGRLAGIGSRNTEAWVGGRYEETDDDDTANVEEQDTDVHALDGLGEVAARVLRLTGCDL